MMMANVINSWVEFQKFLDDCCTRVGADPDFSGHGRWWRTMTYQKFVTDGTVKGERNRRCRGSEQLHTYSRLTRRYTSFLKGWDVRKNALEHFWRRLGLFQPGRNRRDQRLDFARLSEGAAIV